MATLKQQLHDSATHAKGFDPACPKCVEDAQAELAEHPERNAIDYVPPITDGREDRDDS